jgi:hypothetical protein
MISVIGGWLVRERPNVLADQVRPCRVFISYAWDTDPGSDGDMVRKLYEFLRSCGIDAHLDLVAAQGRQDWPLWMADQIRLADHILVIASAAYRAHAQAYSGPQVGRGVQWEARLIRDAFYRDQHALDRFLPVVLPGQSIDDVPDFLAPATTTVYHISEFTVAGAESLLRLLTDQPEYTAPALGERPVLHSHPSPHPHCPPGKGFPRDEAFGHDTDLEGSLTNVVGSTLVLQAAQAVTAAIESLAVRASAPAWSRAVQRLRPTPAARWQAPSWSRVPLADAQADIVARYLASRLCGGLLELLAILELAGHAQQRQHEQNGLAQSFTTELASRLDLPPDQARSLSGQLWADLVGRVRLQVNHLREAEAFADDDLAYALLLTQRPGDGQSGPMLVPAVVERSALSRDTQRIARAHQTVALIARATQTRYAKHVMLHTGEDYQIPIESLYVERTLISNETATATTVAMLDGGVIDVVSGPMTLLGGRSSDIDAADDVTEDRLVDRRVVVVGNPGAGKSTFTRHLLYRLAVAGQQETIDSPVAPMALELKDHPRPTASYLTVLAARLRVVTQAELDLDVIHDILVLGLATVVFDGLDEISAIDERHATVAAIEAFCYRYPLVRVVVTSREEGYVRARLDSRLFPVYRLPDFTDRQVGKYVHTWFELIASRRMLDDSDKRASAFLADSVHVADLRNNPLMLSLLCVLYEYDGYIPENRPQVYEQCSRLLFEKWDRVRRVSMPFRPTADTVKLVQELAYHLFGVAALQGGETEQQLKRLIIGYFERNMADRSIPPATQAEEFLDYCAGRAWLLTNIGTSDRGERLFGFTHRTFMEYFAGCYLARHAKDAPGLIADIKAMISSGASEVVPQIAIQEFDNRAANGIDDCLHLLVTAPPKTNDSEAKQYLAFALRCLRFIRPRRDTLVHLYTEAMRAFGSDLDVGWLGPMFDTPFNPHDLIDDCWGSVLTTTSDKRPADRAFRMGATIIYALADTPVPVLLTLQNSTTLRLPQSTDARIRAAAQIAPDVVPELIRQGLITASGW